MAEGGEALCEDLFHSSIFLPGGFASVSFSLLFDCELRRTTGGTYATLVIGSYQYISCLSIRCIMKYDVAFYRYYSLSIFRTFWTIVLKYLKNSSITERPDYSGCTLSHNIHGTFVRKLRLGGRFFKKSVLVGRYQSAFLFFFFLILPSLKNFIERCARERVFAYIRG